MIAFAICPKAILSSVEDRYFRASNEDLIKIIITRPIAILMPTKIHVFAIKLGPSIAGSENPPNSNIAPHMNKAPPISPAIPKPVACISI